MVQIGQFFYIDLYTTDKLEFRALLELSRTFGSGGISFRNFVGHICPPPLCLEEQSTKIQNVTPLPFSFLPIILCIRLE